MRLHSEDGPHRAHHGGPRSYSQTEGQSLSKRFLWTSFAFWFLILISRCWPGRWDTCTIQVQCESSGHGHVLRTEAFEHGWWCGRASLDVGRGASASASCSRCCAKPRHCERCGALETTKLQQLPCFVGSGYLWKFRISFTLAVWLIWSKCKLTVIHFSPENVFFTLGLIIMQSVPAG